MHIPEEADKSYMTLLKEQGASAVRRVCVGVIKAINGLVFCSIS